MKGSREIATRRAFFVTLFLVVIVLAATILSFSYIYVKTQNDCWTSLFETAYMSEAREVSIITAYKSRLENMASYIAQQGDTKSWFVLSQLLKARVGVLDSHVRFFMPDGYAVVEKGVVYDISDKIRFEDICSETEYLTEVMEDYLNPGSSIIEYRVPVRKGDNIIGMLCAIIDIKSLNDYVRQSLLRSNAYIMTMDRRNDTIFIDTAHENISDLETILSAKTGRGFSKTEFLNAVKKGEDVRYSIIIPETNEKLYLVAITSSEMDWTVITGMRDSVVFASVYRVRHVFAVLFLFVSVAFVIHLVWLYKMMTRQMADENREYSEVALALSKSYESIYYIDASDGSYLEFTPADNSIELEHQRQGTDFFADWMSFCTENAYHDDLELINSLTDKDMFFRRMNADGSISVDYRLVIDGIPVYHRVRAIKSTLNSQYLVVTLENVNNEVLEEKRRQQKLQDNLRIIANQNKALEEQSLLLSRALDTSTEASRAKTQFLSNMSHDIRTPMNAIIGFLDFARKEKDVPEKAKDYLNKASVASAHLLSLINEVLDMSRIESGKMTVDLAPMKISESISGLNNMVSANVREKNLSISFQIDGISHDDVVCDSLKLNQVLLNVISNAVKYTPEGGHITVSVNEELPVHDRTASYIFRVADDGIGMSKEFLATVFEPFTRERNTTMSGVQGTGLGMSITKNIVEMMNGDIAVSSQVGKGTEVVMKFTFDLCEPDDAVVEKVDVKTSFDGMKVLLVEDTETNREIARIILEEYGVLVDDAVNGAEAVEIIEKKPAGTYDLILMDVHMPVMSGYEATKAIRAMADQEKSAVPIVAMTANAFEEDRKASISAGMNGHLVKPIEVPKLKEMLSRYYKG